MNWTEEQLKAIEEEGTNIIVSAGAGSGKTAVLSERVLRKVKDGIHVDELLILTFTNAAAKEMKERIRKKLIKNQLTEELLRLEKSYITTFDAFALATVKKYHEVLNISRDISICDAVFLDLKVEETLDQILEEYYGKEDETFQKFITDFCTKDDKDLKRNILSLYHKLELRYDMEEYLMTYMENYYDESYIEKKLKEYINLLQEKLQKIAEILTDLSLSLSGDEFSKYDSIVKLTECRNYDEMITQFTTNLPRVNKNYDDSAKESKEQLSLLLKELKPYFIYDNEQKIKEEILSTKDSTEVLIKILLKLQRKITDCKKREELYTFTDIFKLAIKLVKEHEEVRKTLSSSFQEIMIDEYQDNNDLQEIFINLISKNNVYMVGDIKQSIYRFRNANPNIFKNKYDLYSKGEEGVKIDLNRNFRSRKEVLADINLLFNDLMDIEIGGASYKDSHQMIFGNQMYIKEGAKDENYHLDILKYEESEIKNISREEQEIFIICQDIKEKIERGFLVFDKDEKCLRQVKYSDIVILLDKTKHFDLYKKIFEYFKIPLSVYKDESLKSNMDIFMMNHILKLVFKVKEKALDTAFQYSFLSVARSYLFRLSDDEVFAYFANKNFETSPIYQKAEQLAERLEQESPLTFYHHLLDVFEIEEKLITTKDLKASRIRLEYFYNMLKGLTEKGYTLYDFSAYLDTLYEKEYDLKFSLNKEEENSCKIMTIHKSKGLEFPICYFASFTSKFNLRDLNERILYDNTYQIVLPSMVEGVKPTIYKHLLRSKNLKEEIGEKIRLLYVALTRSCEKMIMVLPEKEKTVMDKSSYRSFLDMMNAYSDKFASDTKKVEVHVTKDYLNAQNSKILMLDNEEELVVEELDNEKRIIEKQSYAKETLELLTKEKQDIKNFGTKVHEVLEMIDFQKPDYKRVDKNIAQKVSAFLESDMIKENKDSKFYHEYEFVIEKENQIQHGVIDLIIENEEEIIIVDYKLKNIMDENYKLQLNGYKEALKTYTNKPISCYLYSIIEERLLLVSGEKTKNKIETV